MSRRGLVLWLTAAAAATLCAVHPVSSIERELATTAPFD